MVRASIIETHLKKVAPKTRSQLFSQLSGTYEARRKIGFTIVLRKTLTDAFKVLRITDAPMEGSRSKQVEPQTNKRLRVELRHSETDGVSLIFTNHNSIHGQRKLICRGLGSYGVYFVSVTHIGSITFKYSKIAK